MPAYCGTPLGAGPRLASVRRRAESREQLTAAVNSDLLEDQLQMILDGVARNEESLGDRASVESGDERRNDVALTLRERVGAAEQIERLGWSCASKRDGDLPVAVTLEKRSLDLIVDVSATASYTGTFSGTSTLHGILIIHADGSANFHDVETFTGTVNGVPGTVTFNLTGSNDAALAVHATATIVDAGGELAGLHGVLHEVGTVVFPTGPMGTYSGKIG